MLQESTISLSVLTERLAGIDLGPGEARRDVQIRDIRIDSRDVHPGTLFVALPGSQVDGHEFIQDALQAGASALLVQRDRVTTSGELRVGGEVPEEVPLLVAEDTRRELGPLAAEFFDRPAEELTVVGVTGTNGKTTTAHLIAGVLKERWEVGTVGTLGARWASEHRRLPNTTPESIHLQRLFREMRRDEVECVVLEVSSHALATHRVRGTRIDIGVFTNLSQDHLDFHGDLESYREAKATLFDSFMRDREAVGIFNADDRTGRDFAARFSDRPWRVVTYGVGSRGREGRDGVDYEAIPEELTLRGSRFELRYGKGTELLKTPILGDFNISNATAAAGAGLELGLDIDEVRRGLAAMSTVPGRMERVRPEAVQCARLPAVFVDYAHTPEALERALRTLEPLTDGRLIVVFGCGGDRDVGKRAPMGRVAREISDLVFVTSDNPRTEDPVEIIDDILQGIFEKDLSPPGESPTPDRPVSVVADRAEAMRHAIETAGSNDVILIAGKGHEGYQEVDGERRHFDDVEIATSIIEGQDDKRRAQSGHTDE